jgi:large subunit ribosomal protein L17
MRHHNANRKFGFKADQRKAFCVRLLEILVVREKIETTEAKAKELRPFVEKLVTRSKTNSCYQAIFGYSSWPGWCKETCRNNWSKI